MTTVTSTPSEAISDPTNSTAVDPTTPVAVVDDSGRKPFSGAGLAIGWVAAAFANAVTFTPLLAAWFHSTGSKYVSGLAEGTLLPVTYLDIESWTLSLTGFEIVLRSINGFVIFMLVGSAAGIVLGLIGVPLSALIRIIRKLLGYTPSPPSDGLKAFAAWGIVAWGAAILMSAGYSCYAAVFVTPDRAVCVAQQRFENIRLDVAGSCTYCGRFGEKKIVGFPLLSGKDRTLLMGKDGARFLGNDSMSPAAPLHDPVAKVHPQPVSIATAVAICANDKNPNT
jgi:hypothetical protein